MAIASTTWAAWGLLPDGTQEVVWTWGTELNGNKTVIRFPEPYPNSRDKDPLPIPSLAGYQDDSTNISGSIWNAVTATGGTPSLVINGQIRVADEELINCPGLCGKNPRTAMGYTADNKLILMVVDGRQEDLSIGATLEELAEMMLQVGCFGAVNLDGGGSSVIIAEEDQVLNSPSDATGIRAVGSALLIKRRPQYYDTESPTLYTETGAWLETSNEGFYGESRTRLLAVGDGSSYATYTLPPDLPPAQYELSAWWVGASNRSTSTPFVILRNGFEPDTMRIDQTLNSGDFNIVGTFQLGPNDQIIISNATSNGEFVAVDAIRLRKVDESAPFVTFEGESQIDIIQGQQASIIARLLSPNTGLGVEKLRIFKSVNGGTETQLGNEISLNGTIQDSYTLDYQVDQQSGDLVTLRFELEDNQGNIVSEIYTIRVVPFALTFDPDQSAGRHPNGRTLQFDVNVDTQNPALIINSLTVYKSVDGQGEELIQGPINPNASQFSYDFSYLINEGTGKVVSFRFEVTTNNNDTLNKTYEATTFSEKGKIRVAFINDINSSFGSTEYSNSVKDR
ncbi:MAG: hypothetical protein HC880_14680 [Bacteroidia bacterium]|nr:hypothetical protein [Bacteroidia bacterium]